MRNRSFFFFVRGNARIVLQLQYLMGYKGFIFLVMAYLSTVLITKYVKVGVGFY